MPTVDVKIKIDITATLHLTEGHLRALDAMIGYGDDAFLKVFYDRLGKAYMEPSEKDLRDLFGHLRGEVPAALRGVKAAREKLVKQKVET